MSGHNRNGRPNLQLPPGMAQQMVSLDFKPHGGPHADPITAILPTGTGMEVHSWGGFTKLEAAAVQIAAGICAGIRTLPEDPEVVSTVAAVLAESVLIQCGELINQRNKEQQEANNGD